MKGNQAIHACDLCGKRFCIDDMATNRLCYECNEALTHTRKQDSRWLCVAVAVLMLCWAVFFLVLAEKLSAQPWQVEYFVTGVNTTTGERVVGWLDGEMGKSEVRGTVLDHGDRYAVVGMISGKGLFELRSMCCFYDVEVTDEVLADKLLNKRTRSAK